MWKSYRLRSSAIECPKCHTKQHKDELKFIENED